MRALRVVCVCVPLAIPVATVVASCSDPLAGAGALDHAPMGGDGGGLGAGDDGSTISPTEDAPSQFIDVGVPDTQLPLNMFDGSNRPEGGLPVTPEVIACGGATCNAFASAQCCTGEEAGICQTTAIPCATGGSMTCDEADDCVVGKVCCGALGDAGTVDDAAAPPYLSSKCAAACASPPGLQLCRTNDECGDAGPCVIQTCSDGNTYEICGLFAPDDGGGPFSCTPN